MILIIIFLTYHIFSENHRNVSSMTLMSTYNQSA